MGGRFEAGKALPLLLSCRAAAPEGMRRTALDLALAQVYSSLGRPADAAETARRLVAAFPRSERAFGFLTTALWKLGSDDELCQSAKARLAITADDPAPALILYETAAKRGDFDEAEKWLRTIIDKGKATGPVFNNLAWLALVRGKVNDQALEQGQRAVTLDQYKDASFLHTLAALYAEQGKTAEAYQLILQSLAARSAEIPDSDDWFIFGRLAEHYRLPDAARRYYARVTPPKPDAVDAISTYRLARRRLAVLDGKSSR